MDVERAAVWTLALLLGVASVYTLAVQSAGFAVLGVGERPPSTCAPSETALAPEWTDWSDPEPLVGVYDPVLFVEPDREYPYRLLVDDGDGRMDLYESRDFDEFRLVAADVEGAEFASNFNWGRRVDGVYYLFRTVGEERTELWTGRSLTDLRNRGVVLNESDTGGFYDPTTGTWHLYYEEKFGATGENGDALGHAVSTDALHWDRQGTALDVREEDWQTGDPDVVQVDDRYYLFVDETTEHPRYHVQVAVSENLSSFTPLGRVTTACGGDPVVRYLPDHGEFVMLTEYSGEEISGVAVRRSGGPGAGPYELGGQQDVVRTVGNATATPTPVAG